MTTNNGSARSHGSAKRFLSLVTVTLNLILVIQRGTSVRGYYFACPVGTERRNIKMGIWWGGGGATLCQCLFTLV
jgi:hypothetical protein